MHQQMDHFFGGTRGPIRREYPLLKAWAGDEGMIIAAEIPGIDEDALEITIEGRTLTLGGNVVPIELPEGARHYRQERGQGQFSRSVNLPFDVDVDAVNASYDDGLLEITLPRVPEDKLRKIVVNSN
jgi:HSP20 family protein